MPRTRYRPLASQPPSHWLRWLADPIHQQYPFTLARQTGSQIDGGRRFANPSFLIGDSNHTGRHGVRLNRRPRPPSKTYPHETAFGTFLAAVTP